MRDLFLKIEIIPTICTSLIKNKKNILKDQKKYFKSEKVFFIRELNFSKKELPSIKEKFLKFISKAGYISTNDE